VSLAVAILLFGLSYLRLDYFFRFVRRRDPTQAERAMIRRFVAIAVIFAFIFLVCASGYFIIRASFTFAFFLSSLLLFKDNTLLINIVGIIISILFFGFITWIFIFLWQRAKSLPEVPEVYPDTETDVKKIEIILDFAKMTPKQIAEFMDRLKDMSSAQIETFFEEHYAKTVKEETKHTKGKTTKPK
jgi:hypothetical protein